MFKEVFIALLVCLFLITTINAQDISPDRKITFKCENMELEDIIEYLTNKENLYFTYFSSLPSLHKKVTRNIQNMPVKKALDELFKGTNISYQFYKNNIILREYKEAVKDKYTLRGRVLDSDTKEPIQYATVQILNTYKGAIADQYGEFKFTIPSEYKGDTLIISSMGYEPVSLTTNLLSIPGTHKIYLTSKTYKIPGIKVSYERKVIKNMGNPGIFSWGSLYMDTHGQQTAVFIENKKGIEGKVTTINYYLSGKGNTEAPFRIRIYSVDSLTGKPGTDLLPEIIVVKPDQGSGWYKVNVTKFDIEIPDYGIFVAMEGVYPNDFDFYHDDAGFVDISDGDENTEADYMTNSITYGQRLGYNKKGSNHTWHYSLDQEWFQIDKRIFNVMISADIETNKAGIRIFKR